MTNTVTPVCKTETSPDLGVIGSCVACVENSDCQGETPVCCGNVCKACCDSGDCTTENLPLCDVSVASHRCVQCEDDPDCTASGSTQNPFCVDKTCVGCRTSADCIGGVPCTDGQCQITGCSSTVQCNSASQWDKCDISLGQCVQCTTSADCTNPTTPVCGKKGTANYDECVGCKNNDDCVGIPTGPFCDTVSGMCKGCLGDGDCSGDPNNPVCCEGSVCCPCEAGKAGACAAYGYLCDVVEKACKQCLVDGDCPSGRCLNDVCVECTEEADCATGTYCDVSSNTCIDGCNDDSDCDTGNQPFCHTDNHQCVQCTTNAPGSTQCSDMPGTVCELVGPARINECVECSPSIADSCPANQVCNPGSGTCVPCLENSDCDGNTGGNLCFVHPTSPALNACVPCLEDEGGCPTGQVCKLDGNGGNSCVACLDSDNCPNGVCDTATNICVPCLADNTGCQDPTPICNTLGQSPKCVACTENSQCGGSTPYCDTTTNTCTTCLVGNPSTCPTNNPVCIALDNGGTTCVQCDGTNDAYCGADQQCLVSQNRCVSCITNSDCALNGVNNRCSPYNKCVPECSNDSDCSGQTPICEGGKCVPNKVTQQSVITGFLSGRYTCPMIPGLWAAATGQRAGTCGQNGSGCCHCPKCGNGASRFSCRLNLSRSLPLCPSAPLPLCPSYPRPVPDRPSGCPFYKCGKGSGCGNRNNYGCLG